MPPFAVTDEVAVAPVGLPAPARLNVSVSESVSVPAMVNRRTPKASVAEPVWVTVDPGAVFSFSLGITYDAVVVPPNASLIATVKPSPVAFGSASACHSASLRTAEV